MPTKTYSAGDFDTLAAQGSYDSLVTYTASTTAALADAGQLVFVNTAGASTYTLAADVPATFSYDQAGHIIGAATPGLTFPIGSVIDVMQGGAGAVTITAGNGVTLVKPTAATFATASEYSVLHLVKIAANTWAVR